MGFLLILLIHEYYFAFEVAIFICLSFLLKSELLWWWWNCLWCIWMETQVYLKKQLQCRRQQCQFLHIALGLEDHMSLEHLLSWLSLVSDKAVNQCASCGGGLCDVLIFPQRNRLKLGQVKNFPWVLSFSKIFWFLTFKFFVCGKWPCFLKKILSQNSFGFWQFLVKKLSFHFSGFLFLDEKLETFC